MITAVLDTNLFVQYLISPPRSASVRTIEAYFEGRFSIAYSSSMFDELLDVLLLPRIRERHSLTETEILEYLAALLVGAESFPGVLRVSPRITRDLTDTKFLAVAVEAEADYLVTNDHRHLLRLRRYRGTRIVTPSQFLRELH
jgi:putative PIN family toxin of toxin-antitoxin system